MLLLESHHTLAQELSLQGAVINLALSWLQTYCIRQKSHVRDSIRPIADYSSWSRQRIL